MPPLGQMALQGMSSSGAMFIDPDPLCPSHGHLYRTPHHAARHQPSTHSLLFPLDRWNSADTDDPTKGDRAEPRCPGCDAPFTAADVCHCDCTRPDVADVDRPSSLSSPPASGGSAVRAPTPPPPVAVLQTDDLKLQKTRRKSVAGTNSTSASAAAARKQSAATPLHATDDGNLSAAEMRHHAGEVEPLLVTAAVLYDDDDDEDEDEVGDDDGELTSPLRVMCRNVEQRDVSGGGSDVTRTVA